jgi:hypothetical protein
MRGSSVQHGRNTAPCWTSVGPSPFAPWRWHGNHTNQRCFASSRECNKATRGRGVDARHDPGGRGWFPPPPRFAAAALVGPCRLGAHAPAARGGLSPPPTLFPPGLLEIKKRPIYAAPAPSLKPPEALGVWTARDLLYLQRDLRVGHLAAFIKGRRVLNLLGQIPTFGVQCRFIAALQTWRRGVAKGRS